ncbi:MAG: ABC transporter permease, partial [Treponema sp.]|nr:ABC transporter permease [Treponema sp.]
MQEDSNKTKALKKANPGPFYAWPMGLWFTIFFIAPIVIIVCYSFMKRDVYGGVEAKFTLKAYQQMLDPAYGKIFLRTLFIAVLSSFLCIAIALPCGYAIARSRHQTLFLILVIIPFLTNSLIRIFAWMTILGDNGLLNSFLRFLHFAPRKFMFTKGAI